MSQVGDALTDATLDPPVAALVCWSSNPAQVAPEQEKVLAGLRRDDLFTVVLEQFMTDTARHADVVLPSTTQLEHLDVVGSWGHQYVTWNEPAIAPRGGGQAQHGGVPAPGGRAWVSMTRASPRPTRSWWPRSWTAHRAACRSETLRARGFAKVDVGQGAAPHAEGGFSTADGKLSFETGWLADAGLDPMPGYDPPAEAAGAGAGERFPLALITPKTHLFLNSTFANQARQHSAQPEPYVVVNPDDAAARGLVDGEPRPGVQRPRLVRVRGRGSPTTHRRAWWSRRPAGGREDYDGGVGPQATTSQDLTALGAAPVFNDNRVEVESK